MKIEPEKDMWQVVIVGPEGQTAHLRFDSLLIDLARQPVEVFLPSVRQGIEQALALTK